MDELEYEYGDPDDNYGFDDEAPDVKQIWVINLRQTCLGVSHQGNAYYYCRVERAAKFPAEISFSYMNVPLPEGTVVRWMDGYTEYHRSDIEAEFIAQALER